MIGNSFTLKRFSDDRVTIIANVVHSPLPKRFEITANSSKVILDNLFDNEDSLSADIPSQKVQSLEGLKLTELKEHKISEKEFFNEIGKLFDTIISVLTPTETINLVSGFPSKESIQIILEITKIRHKKIFSFINTQQKIATIFAIFGKSLGLDSLRDKLLLITASPRLNNKFVPIKNCPPFEDFFAFRKELLKKTFSDDLIDKVINDLVEERKNRFNNIQNGLANIKNGVPFDLKELLCGTR